MKISKNLGIWMDHSSAFVMDYSNDKVETNVIHAHKVVVKKDKRIAKSESQEHNIENQHQADYYKKLSEAIKGYTHVLLFGPTQAKVELKNILREYHHYDKVDIVIKQTDKMTEHQKTEFVRNHFDSQVQHPQKK